MVMTIVMVMVDFVVTNVIVTVDNSEEVEPDLKFE